MSKLAPICLLATAVALASAPLVLPGQKPWIEVRSPNFRVLTDGSANDGRRLAREFEQMRAVFAVAFPKMRLDTGAAFVIFAPRDEGEMKAMAPAYWKGSGPKPAGLFQHGWERQYAVVRLDQDVLGKNNVVYHEYVHTLLHANFQWLPTWLDEGLAEFYGNTRFEQTKMYVGAPSTRVYNLRDASLIKLDELISENPWSKYRNDERRIDLFYAEAWALVHYLIFGPDMQQGAKLNKFQRALLNREDQKKAFQEVLGNFDDVEKGLRAYTNKFTFTTYVLTNPPQIQEKEFPSRVLSIAETEAELGTYRFWSHDREEARQAIEQALRDDANLALAHETLGFLDLAEGKDDDARSELAKAYAGDPQRYLSLFYQTMLACRSKSTAPADQSSLRTAMYAVAGTNPRFAPAFVELAFAMARGGDLTDALAEAQQAESLEPNRAGYHLLRARILAALGRNPEALKEIAFVADRFRGPDRDEAIELWDSIPGEKHPPDMTLIEDALTNTKTSQGVVVSVACGDKDLGTKLVIQSADGPQTFRSAAARRIGYSDTLWWGGDHFTVCHHLEGLRAIVRFKPETGKETLGEWVTLDLRQDLPPADGKPADPAAAKN